MSRDIFCYMTLHCYMALEYDSVFLYEFTFSKSFELLLNLLVDESILDIQ